MTAEVAVMNKLGVALAADSAVTAGTVDKPKIYNSVNKLFALSKYEPVGVMVYGFAELMAVPWESILKTYRAELGKRNFDTLGEYAAHFVGFLDQPNVLFGEKAQADYVSGTIFSLFGAMLDQINRRVDEVREKEGNVSDAQVRRIVSAEIKIMHESWRKAPLLEHLKPSHVQKVIRQYSTVFRDIRNRVFEQLPMSATTLKRLKELSAYVFVKRKLTPMAKSGVVIAGFGTGESFPCLIEYEIEAIVADRLKYFEQQKVSVNPDVNAAIVPFAQTDMVYNFIQGISRDLEDTLRGYLSELFLNNYPAIVGDIIPGIAEAEKSRFIKKMEEAGKGQAEAFIDRLRQYARDKHVNPILDAVAVQPKDELGAMAEALVNLTSLKQKISVGMETVGGPIDVALISKGDGFIWIKRKHYFKPELNQHFFANYFRGER